MNFIKKWKTKKRCKQGDYPPYICSYFNAIFEKDTIKNTPYEQLRYVVLDTETTGLDTKKDVLLSIGAVSIENKAIQVHSALEIVLNTKQVLKEAAVKIHGLTQEDLENGMEVSLALKQFLEYLDADVILAHHTFFDVTMLEKAFQAHLKQAFKFINPMLDTAHLAERISTLENPYLTTKNYDLDSLCKTYDIEKTDRHTAWGDALITAKLFLKLSRILENRGVRTFGDLSRRS